MEYRREDDDDDELSFSNEQIDFKILQAISFVTF